LRNHKGRRKSAPLVLPPRPRRSPGRRSIASSCPGCILRMLGDLLAWCEGLSHTALAQLEHDSVTPAWTVRVAWAVHHFQEAGCRLVERLDQQAGVLDLSRD